MLYQKSSFLCVSITNFDNKYDHLQGWPARYDHAIHRSNVHAVTPEQEAAFQVGVEGQGG